MIEFPPNFQFTLTYDPWDLHNRSIRDIARHNQKVQGAIRENLSEVISREDIVTSDGRKLIKIPVKGVELPHFRFDPYTREQIGQGQGNTQPGTILGEEGAEGKKAGNAPGTDIYETEITVDELIDLAFEELGLPNLENKGRQRLTETDLVYDTIRKKGPQANLDKKRTLVEAFKRNALLGKPSWKIDTNQDPRYKSWEEIQRPIKNAVVLAMRDVSGSMGENEAYISRTFFTWMTRFLRKCYTGVDIAFITHHTEAQEVNEASFFSLSGSGGTKVSSAYEKALEVIDRRYNPAIWNIYPFLLSDGDNWGDADNQKCIELTRRLVDVSNLVGYGELGNYGYWGGAVMSAGVTQWAPLGQTYKQAFASEPRFAMVQIKDTKDVWPALKHFLGKRHEELAA